MKMFLRVVFLGLVLWMSLFAVGAAAFVLKKTSHPEIFESVMTIALTLLTVLASVFLFRKANKGYLQLGIFAGLAWLVINIGCDIPVFLASFSPNFLKKSWMAYISDIGLGYLAIPMIPFGMGLILKEKQTLSA